MPPPRLPRHLRPCHPSWRAHQLRRASSTPPAARTKPPSPSDDPHESPSTDGRHDTGSAPGREGWWSAAVAKVSSLGIRSPPEDPPVHVASAPSAELVPESPAKKRAPKRPQPPAPPETPKTPKTEETPEAVVKDLSSTEPAKRRTWHQQLPAKQPPLRIARHASSKGAPSPLAFRPSKFVKPTQNDAAEVRPEGNFQAANSPHEAVHAVDMTDQKAVARQLAQLFDQVKVLQDTLAKTQATHAPSPQAGGDRATASTDDGTRTAETTSTATHPSKLLAASKPTPSTPSTPPLARHFIRSVPKAEEVRQSARYAYRNSTIALVKIVRELEKDLPRVATPIVSLIRKRLAVIARDALESRDDYMAKAVKANRTFSLRPLVREELGLAELANVDYRRMASVLATIAASLDSLTSPAVAHITSMVRDRLHVMVEEAKSEKDEKMRQALQGAQDYGVQPSHDRSTAFALPESAKLSKAEIPDQQLEALVSSSHVRIPNTEKVKSGEVEQYQEDPANAENSSESLRGSANKNMPETKDTGRNAGEHNKQKRLAHQIHTHSRSMKSSDHSNINALGESNEEVPLSPPQNSTSNVRPSPTVPSQPNAQDSEEISEQSLLEELFPEVTTAPISRDDEKRDKYHKLEPPASNKVIRRELVDGPRTLKEQVFQSLHSKGEQITVLQLEHCSTELTEIDFRRLVPKGKHLEGWNTNGDFLKVIPGRDPLSLERLPFYYLLFQTPESAHAYQNNATRIHKLAALHQPSNVFSAIPPPKGFLEDGEDIGSLSASYVLKPTEHAMTLRTLMQPYNPALRALIEQGGYNPIVPDVDDKGNRVYKVLMHIEGYEPSRSDLFKIFRRDAYHRGLTLSLRNEVSSSIHRLRDIINLKTRTQPISTTNPRAFSHWESSDTSSIIEFDDPSIASFLKNDAEGEQDGAKTINQIVMNRVYNRWLIEFDDEDEARRFAIAWHRRRLPDLVKGDKTWRDYEEVRMCNCEVLW